MSDPKKVISFEGVKRPAADKPAAEEKTPNEFWMNWGYIDPDDGEFVPAPRGVALDSMEAEEPPMLNEKGTNLAYVTLRQRQADFTAHIKEQCSTMTPGEERDLLVVCRIRRIKDKTPVDVKPRVNVFTSGKVKLFG